MVSRSRKVTSRETWLPMASDLAVRGEHRRVRPVLRVALGAGAGGHRDALQHLGGVEVDHGDGVLAVAGDVGARRVRAREGDGVRGDAHVDARRRRWHRLLQRARVDDGQRGALLVDVAGVLQRAHQIEVADHQALAVLGEDDVARVVVDAHLAEDAEVVEGEHLRVPGLHAGAMRGVRPAGGQRRVAERGEQAPGADVHRQVMRAIDAHRVAAHREAGEAVAGAQVDERQGVGVAVGDHHGARGRIGHRLEAIGEGVACVGVVLVRRCSARPSRRRRRAPPRRGARRARAWPGSWGDGEVVALPSRARPPSAMRFCSKSAPTRVTVRVRRRRRWPARRRRSASRCWHR